MIILLTLPQNVNNILILVMIDVEQYLTKVKTTFSLEKISSQDVKKCIDSIARNKATGLDQIPACVIKDAIDYIILPLTHIVNLSLNSGKMPDTWKKVRVTPIFKSGDTTKPSNYRPISVLPILSIVKSVGKDCVQPSVQLHFQ